MKESTEGKSERRPSSLEQRRKADETGRASASLLQAFADGERFEKQERLREDLRQRLARYFETLARADGTVRDACRQAFDDEEKFRKNPVDLVKAALRMGVLIVRAASLPDLAGLLKARFHLRFVEVLNADTTTKDGQGQFGIAAAQVFLKCLHDHLSQRDRLDIAVGGGRTIRNLIESLKILSPAAETFSLRVGDRVHLWTPTVGHLAEELECSCQILTVELGRLLGIPQGNWHVVSGPSDFSSPEERRIFEKRADVQKALIAAQHDISFVVTSCGAGPNNYCIRIMGMSAAKRGTKHKVAGELLFQPYDERGAPIKGGSFERTFSLFAGKGRTLVERLAGTALGRPSFESLGLLCHYNAEDLREKVRAAWGAIGGNGGPWFNSLVCTAAVAEELLRKPPPP
jgi:DNA-binding transcriptional regulator LsrR (DeoR family)